ncbi:MAG: Sapep family Mn(2+)-dependent dipeptidase, partial [Clostridia bacterium]|nr:Sapep family Mn(2+)-dependent dipeptidase [Clostridia bacterium]
MKNTPSYPDLLPRFFELLSIESVKGTPLDGAPFGYGVKKALDYTLDLAKSFGFETKNYDGFVGEVTFGSGKPFAVLCHLDVVPAGNENAWISPPFKPEIRDGNLYCRGVLDDKCGAICSLFALKRLKDEGARPTRQIKLILGCDEESGWGCIDHYLEKAVMPEDGISPDADFPVIYAEKGIVHAKFRLK